MTHPTEEEMVDRYYSGAGADLEAHLAICRECRALYRAICETLEMAAEDHLPERGSDYGAQVWARVSAQLPVKSQKKWLLIPALAASLALMFAAGMWTEHGMENAPPLQVTFIHAPAVYIAQPVVRTHPRTPKPVLRALTDAEQDKRLLALNGGLEADAKTALPKVLAVINGETSDRTKEHALFVLAQSDSAQAREELMNIARDAAKPDLQTKAVRMMGMMGDENARRELAGLYRTSSNPGLKREILNGLMFSGSKTTLLKVAKTEPDPELRNSAIANLSITALPDQVTTFALRGAPHAEKNQILNSVFLAGDSPVLLNVLKRQPDPGVRVATVRSLAVMGERGKVLINVYRTDNDEDVKRAVLDALVVQQNGDALVELERQEPDVQRKKEILSRLATIRVQETFK